MYVCRYVFVCMCVCALLAIQAETSESLGCQLCVPNLIMLSRRVTWPKRSKMNDEFALKRMGQTQTLYPKHKHFCTIFAPVCMYVCIYVRIDVCMYVYKYAGLSLSYVKSFFILPLWRYLCTYVCVYACMCMYAFVYTRWIRLFLQADFMHIAVVHVKKS